MSSIPTPTFPYLLGTPSEVLREILRYVYEDTILTLTKVEQCYNDEFNNRAYWQWRNRSKLEVTCKRLRRECLPVRTASTRVFIKAKDLPTVERNDQWHDDCELCAKCWIRDEAICTIPTPIRQRLRSINIAGIDMSLVDTGHSYDIGRLPGAERVILQSDVRVAQIEPSSMSRDSIKSYALRDFDSYIYAHPTSTIELKATLASFKVFGSILNEALIDSETGTLLEWWGWERSVTGEVIGWERLALPA